MDPNRLLDNIYGNLMESWHVSGEENRDMQEALEKIREHMTPDERKRKYESAIKSLGSDVIHSKYETNAGTRYSKHITTSSAHYFASIFSAENFWEFSRLVEEEAQRYTSENNLSTEFPTNNMVRKVLTDKLMYLWVSIDESDTFHSLPLEWRVSILIKEDAGELERALEASLGEFEL